MAQPGESASPTPAEWRERLERRPLPGDIPAPWEREQGMDAYELAAETAAHAFLVLVDERPELLDGDDEFGPELWQAFKERWPEGNDWLGGITGFQFGWAHNTVRYIVGRPIVGNPAIVEVERWRSRDESHSPGRLHLYSCQIRILGELHIFELAESDLEAVLASGADIEVRIR